MHVYFNIATYNFIITKKIYLVSIIRKLLKNNHKDFRRSNLRYDSISEIYSANFKKHNSEDNLIFKYCYLPDWPGNILRAKIS